MKTFMILLSVCSLWAQKDTTSVWSNEVVSTLNYTNSSFDNWVAGGDDAFTWELNVLASFGLDKKDMSWENTIKLAYGETKVSGSVPDEAKKTSDEIKVESVLKYKMGIAINPYLATTGQTQFTKSYSYKALPKTAISDFMDPAYFTQSLGVGYAKGKQFKTRAGFSIKETITSKFTSFADDPKTTEIEETRVDYGMELVTDYNNKISKNILLKSKLEIFSDFSGIKHVDVAWDNLFSAKVSEIISVSFNYKLVYDSNISAKRQTRRVLSAGLTYSIL